MGSEGILPNTYGKKAEALADLMNACLLKARVKNKDGSLTEVPPIYETKIIPSRYAKSGVESAQIRELQISHQSRALRFLRPADYALVILCGLWLISVLLDIRTGIGILKLIFIGFMAFCVYTGWRHVGVIDSRVWKTHIIVFPVLLFLCLVVLSSIDIESNLKGGQVAETLLNILTLLWITSAAVSGFVAMLLLGAIRIGGVNMAVPKLLSMLRNRRISLGFNPKTLKRVNTRRGIIMSVLGVIIILSTALAPLPKIEPIAQFLKFYGALHLFGFLLLLFAKRYLQTSADSLLSSDKRRPILFLRSFEDDEKQQLKTSEKSFLDFSLETRLAKHFGHFGPFIAIGSPQESVPQLGAARAVLSGHKWQSNVLSWIENASLIIMYAGKTHWVNWELAKVIEAEQIANLILLIPELKGSRCQRDEEITLRFERVRHVFRDTIWSKSLADLPSLQHVRAITFCEDGLVFVIKSRPRNRDSYHLAALVAHYLILNKTMS
jgi:hypothetical protein